MLQDSLLLIISLLFAVSMLAILSDKLKVSYPVFLVIAGLLISLVPGIPDISLEPDLVFVVFLPPLLYYSAWWTSWNDFWRMRRPIALLAFGLVVFTAIGVAWVSHMMIPGFPLALGFVLGGIVSPTDAVAATAVIQKANLPKRLVTILEGESLVNDASGIVIYRFALAAVLTGHFVLWKAGVNFLEVASMGIVIGLAIGGVAYAIHRWLPTTASVDASITLITPYLMYITAEHYHFSGVLAVVSGGLFLSYRSHRVFTYETRLLAQSVWNVLVFLLNGVVFIMIGLQLPFIVKGLGEYSLTAAIGYGLVISLVAMAIRIAWVYPGAYLPRMCSRKISLRESDPGKRAVFIEGWSGMRGVLSLAAALALPLTLTTGERFPHRNLILFITFSVILFTIVIQGLSLPWVIRWLRITNDETDRQPELELRLQLATAVLAHITADYGEESTTIDAFIRLRQRYERMVRITEQRKEKDDTPTFLPRYRQLLLELVDIQRKELVNLRRDDTFPEELLRNKELELDLEEARFRN